MEDMKYVVDTCIINKLVEGVLDPSDLPADGEYLATHIQIDELNRTKDEEKRAKLFLVFAKNVKSVVPTETTIVGVSRLGNSRLGDGKLYTKIRKGLDQRNGRKRNNVHDALIAEVALKRGFTLLTTDRDLFEVVEELGGIVRYWSPE